MHRPRCSWVAAAFFAIVVAEWLIHVPLFNVLLGFPIQFIGLVVTPYLALRYYVDKEGTPLADAEASVHSLTQLGLLPGAASAQAGACWDERPATFLACHSKPA